MRDFFGLDGPVNKYGSFLADVLILSLLWLIFSIPLITIGASTSALFYVSTRRIADREGYIASDFWAGFKSSFARGTKIWIMMALAILLMWFNIQVTMVSDVVGNMSPIVMVVNAVLLLQLIGFMGTYMFALVARFDMGVIQIIKSAFFLSNRHFLTTLSCICVFLTLFFLAYNFPPILIVLPGGYAIGSSYFIMKILKKYRPEMDKDPVLEIQEREAQLAEERRRAAFAGADEMDEDADIVTDAE